MKGVNIWIGGRIRCFEGRRSRQSGFAEMTIARCLTVTALIPLFEYTWIGPLSERLRRTRSLYETKTNEAFKEISRHKIHIGCAGISQTLLGFHLSLPKGLIEFDSTGCSRCVVHDAVKAVVQHYSPRTTRSPSRKSWKTSLWGFIYYAIVHLGCESQID